MKSIRTRIAHFRDETSRSPTELFEYFEDGVILFDEGKIVAVDTVESIKSQGYDVAQCEHLPEHLLLAGFIDSHVHAPQLDVLASYGEQLMEWLEKYTFPTEMKFADPRHSEAESERFINALLAHGTTSAMVFATSFAHSVDHLFESAAKRDMRFITGKVLMDRNAPPGLLDRVDQAKRETTALIDRWHRHRRLAYALTPRFSATSTHEQLEFTGDILRAHPDIYLQTHLSENLSEIALIRKLFPDSRDYLATYEKFGLVGATSNFAHGIYLSPDEIHRLSHSGACISFCPSSNLFLGSGLFDLATLKSAGIPIALASDVGGGTSLSQFRTMADAYKVCQLKGYSLDALEAFYLSSLGAARALRIDKFVGSLDKGKEADFILVNTQSAPLLHERRQRCRTIEEEMFVYMIMGDERLIARTYVAGELQYEHGAA